MRRKDALTPAKPAGQQLVRERFGELLVVAQEIQIQLAGFGVNQLRAQKACERRRVLVAVLLEQRQHFFAEPPTELRDVVDHIFALQEERVANLLLVPGLLRDAPVQRREELVEGEVSGGASREERGFGRKLDEREPPPERSIEEADASVGRVHRPEQKHVRRDEEGVLALRERYGKPALVRLEERDQLAEDLGDVGSIDLVHEYKEGLGRLTKRRHANPPEDPRLEPKRERSGAVVVGPEALDEVLIPVRGMERDSG
jgi:hypothetical protein